MPRRILESVRVLDLTQIVAGPYCTRMLADLGADVVKVDTPAPAKSKDEQRPSAGPAAQNLGKRSIVLDLKQPEGLAIARRLADQADVLVQNFRPGALKKLGLGYQELSATNPRLIYTSISGFGPNTSYASRGAYGATAHAEAGWLWVQQQAQGGDEPFAPGVTVADIATGMNACTAILAALYDREHTGQGQEIDISLMDSQLAFVAEAAAPAMAGVDEANWVPFRHGLQAAKDGYLAINLGSPRNWKRLAAAMGNAELPMPGEREEAERLLAEWVAGCSIAEASEALLEAGAPYGVLNSMQQALNHPYVAERGMIVEIPGAKSSPVKAISSPLYFSDAVSAPAMRAPMAGEHSLEVLREIGCEEGQIATLLELNAIQQAPSTD